MYWGLLGCSFIAFSASTEFIPEINERLKLVPFSSEFKMTLTALMIIDYCGCWIVEKVLKSLFSDFRPKEIAMRRPDQLLVEEKRRNEEEDRITREKEAAIEKANGTYVPPHR